VSVTTDIYIYAGNLMAIQRSVGDLTGIPLAASLFAEGVWATMCKEAGGEALLITALGVRDAREVVNA
jgi:hypothetical protein